ncbi:MAG: hypothetical protein SFU27_10660 [Thermonemataceae bacterium]|nr:hypothetical protein [Thermonemataceae bacterium]
MMMTNNEKFLQILQEKGLDLTYFIRYIYLLKNEQGELLVTHKTEPTDVGNLYVGWHILSEVHWGTDWDEDDILKLAQLCIELFTNIWIDKVGLVDIFVGNSQGQEVLMLVFYGVIEDSTDFEFWYEYDEEAVWLDKYEAIKQVSFEEDKEILRSFISDGLKPALLGFPTNELEEETKIEEEKPRYNYALFPCKQAVATWANFYLGWYDTTFCDYPIAWQMLKENPKYSAFFPLLEKTLLQFANLNKKKAILLLVFDYVCEVEIGYVPAQEVYHNGVGDIENNIFLGNFFYFQPQNFIGVETEKAQFESLMQEYITLRKAPLDTLLADKFSETKNILNQILSLQTQIFSQFEQETFEYPTQVVFDFQSDTHALLREWNKCYEQHRTYYHQLANQDHNEEAISQARIALEIAQVM